MWRFNVCLNVYKIGMKGNGDFMTTIFGVRLSKRMDNATAFQDILSKYGCIIKTRVGLHDISCGVCSPFGIIILEVINDEKMIDAMVMDFQALEGVKFNIMEL